MLIAAALAALPLLSLLAIVAGGRAATHRLVAAGCAAASLALLAAGIGQLFGGEPAPTVVLPLGLPWGAVHLRLDALSALFLVVVDFPAAAAALYTIGYASHLPEPRRVTPFLPLFLFGMNGVLLADDAVTFLMAWEFMSLASWLMVVSDHRSADSRAAGQLYLTMALFGTLCLLGAFAALAGPAGAWDFTALRAAAPAASVAAVVPLALIGAGSKAGLAPLHVWLPEAHPAAPSPVSALMSGVMTKVALYALIRLLFDLVGRVPWEWGAALMAIGGVSAVLGVLHALVQDDLKRLLAYSTVENVGIVAIGLGLALAFKDGGEPALAALALVGALYHIVNHATFKTLLFLAAGAVQAATGERRLGALGGLLKQMPWTGAAALVGALAIASLPPLNGFVSEWLILQALFKGPSLPLWAMKFGVPVVAALLALAAALAAACFVRAYGIAFLGRPRSLAAAQAGAHPTPVTMRLSMAVLAASCLLLGAIPVTVTDALSAVVVPITGGPFAVSSDLGWPWLSPAGASRGSYSGTVLVLVGLALFGVVVAVAHGFGAPRARRADPWDCGNPDGLLLPETQYTAQSFSQPQRRVFGAALFGVVETVEMPEPGSTQPARHGVRSIDPVWDGLYRPLIRAVEALADRVNRLQFLTVRGYLLMMFATLVLMLLVVAWRQRS
ncbi:hydrogenase 4 subunit B [Phaeospirillum tilakii]|uniref:Hydrogenase 4 subunit B n=1 Tax=Phaeospirillum tilakii TaxID=741673 RepID=A0ABW5CFL6_9PROT